MTDAPTRRELHELYIANDAFARETDDWLARHKAERAALARENAAAEGLERRAYEIEQAPSAAAETVPFSEEEPEPFDDEQLDVLAITLAELCKRWERDATQQTNQMDRALRQEIEHAVAHNAALRRDLAELRGKLDALLTLLGHKARNISDENNSKSADVIDLPAGFIRKRNDDAA
jgi:hypothetical protein